MSGRANTSLDALLDELRSALGSSEINGERLDKLEALSGSWLDPWATALESVLDELDPEDPRDTLAAALVDGQQIEARELWSSHWWARTYKLTSEQSAIVATSGFRDAIYTLAKLGLCLLDVKGHPEDLLDPDLATRVLRTNLLGPRIRGEWAPLISAQPDAFRQSLALDLTLLAEQFIIRHELAHVALGHFSDAPPLFFLGAGARLTDVAPEFSQLGGASREVQADILAVVSTLRTQREGAGIDWLRNRVAGIVLAICALGALDEAHFWVQPGSHPSMDRRLLLILEVVVYSLVTNHSLSDAEDLRSALSLSSVFNYLAKRATDFDYESPYGESLSAEVKASPLLQAATEDAVALDDVDTVERLLRLPAMLHMNALARSNPIVLDDVLAEAVTADIVEAQGSSYEKMLLIAESFERSPGQTPEALLVQWAVQHVWFWERVVVPFGRRRGLADPFAVPAMPSLFNLVKQIVPNERCLIPTLGLLAKLRAGDYKVIQPGAGTAYRIAKSMGVSDLNPLDFLLRQADLPLSMRMEANGRSGVQQVPAVLDFQLNRFVGEFERRRRTQSES